MHLIGYLPSYIQCALMELLIITMKYHPFTTSTNHTNSKADLTTLSLVQVETHNMTFTTWKSGEYWTILVPCKA